MTDIVFKPGEEPDEPRPLESYAKGCCPCCGTPCFDTCELCERKEGIAGVQEEPSACTPRCCTCFPGSTKVIDRMGTDEDIGYSDVELEASFFLGNAGADREDLENAGKCLQTKTAGSPPTTEVNSKCNGKYLGSITLCGGNRLGKVKNAADQDISNIEALCIRQTDSATPYNASPNQNCKKQIGGQYSGNRADPDDIYEIWCGWGRICYDDQKPGSTAGAKAGGPDYKEAPNEDTCTVGADQSLCDPLKDGRRGDKADGCEAAHDSGTGQVKVGQVVEMSICCCMGNNFKGSDDESTKGDCHKGPMGGIAYNCETIKRDVGVEDGAEAKVDIDQVCSCACYTVDFKMHDPAAYPYLKPSSTNTCGTYMPSSHECHSTTVAGGGGCAGQSKCPMQITDCRCMDVIAPDDAADLDDAHPPEPRYVDGWYICAEYYNPAVFSCNCCPGDPTEPEGGGGGGGGGGGSGPQRGGCLGGPLIRAFITVKDGTTAADHGRDASDHESHDEDKLTYCPTCGSNE